MRQVVRVDNHVEVRDVPQPKVHSGFVLVKNICSLISTGTETRALRDSRNKIKNILRASKKILTKSNSGSNLGYSCSGEIIDQGKDVTNFSRGDRVLCVGSDYAVHAEFVSVPQQLVFPLPDEVTSAQASFAPLASVALHALRRSNIALGETALVVGLGLLGQLVIRLLHLNGCRVIGDDPHQYKIDLAKKSGGQYFQGKEGFSKKVLDIIQHGADVAFICVDLSQDSHLEEICRSLRDKGKVVTVANVRCMLPFSLFFRKELDFLASRSFGPGRYDSSYEEGGVDYPYSYVRWTERRNIEEALHLIASHKLSVDELLTGQYALRDAKKAYQQLLGKERPIALLLNYSS